MNDINKIENVIKLYQDAIHTQNKDDFKELWTCDKNNTMISVTKKFFGIDSICDDFLIGAIHQSYSTIDLIMDETDIKLINENMAIVVLEYHTECIRRNTGEPYGIAGIETQVLLKVDNEWKLQHIHYSKG